ncbi:MAG: hypothetical protein AB7T08_06570, partial [Hyphomonadaceae bacterium]
MRYSLDRCPIDTGEVHFLISFWPWALCCTVLALLRNSTSGQEIPTVLLVLASWICGDCLSQGLYVSLHPTDIYWRGGDDAENLALVWFGRFGPLAYALTVLPTTRR